VISPIISYRYFCEREFRRLNGLDGFSDDFMFCFNVSIVMPPMTRNRLPRQPIWQENLSLAVHRVTENIARHLASMHVAAEEKSMSIGSSA
jgi:hypothetical protein